MAGLSNRYSSEYVVFLYYDRSCSVCNIVLHLHVANTDSYLYMHGHALHHNNSLQLGNGNDCARQQNCMCELHTPHKIDKNHCNIVAPNTTGMS